MALAGLFILLQDLYSTAPLAFLIAFSMLMVCGVIALVWYALTRSSTEEHQHDREGSFYQYPPSREAAEPSASEPEEEPTPPLPSFSRSPSYTDWKAPDTPSSPVGGTCLACGAKVTEETSTSCPECGAERQRCPICQRYVAGGQDLLACVHCRTPGHANEMLAWVEQRGTCPYCARRIDKDEFKPLQGLTRVRRRKR
jgi:hypothetical protein